MAYFFYHLVLFRGKMGASKDRLAKEQAVGVKPPYLMVYYQFMFIFKMQSYYTHTHTN